MGATPVPSDAIKLVFENSDSSDFPEITVDRARPRDADGITELFVGEDGEYDMYFGLYSNPDEMEEFIHETLNDLTRGDRPEQDIVVARGPEDEIVGVTAAKYESNDWAEIASEVVHQDFRGVGLPNGNTVYREVLQQAIESAERNVDRLYTACVSSKSAKSQLVSQKEGFNAMGFSEGHYFRAYDDEGRISTAFMVDGDFTEGGEVYATESIEGAVRQARENGDLERDIRIDGYQELEGTEFAVHEKYEAPGVGMAELSLVPAEESETGETIEADEVEQWVEENYRDEEIEWMNVSFDANHETSPAMIEMLEQYGFDFERFQPDGLKTGENQYRDAIGMQSRPNEIWERNLIEPVYKVAEEAGIIHSVEDKKEISGTTVYKVKM